MLEDRRKANLWITNYPFIVCHYLLSHKLNMVQLYNKIFKLQLPEINSCQEHNICAIL